jgi:hypothetical protein
LVKMNSDFFSIWRLSTDIATSQACTIPALKA